MRILLSSLFVLLSFAANAVEYSEKTELPLELRAKIAVAVATKCPYLVNLVERSTTVREDRIDQGVVDYYFTTILDGEVGVNQFVIVPAAVIVESAIYAMNNPTAGDNTVVESISCQ